MMKGEILTYSLSSCSAFSTEKIKITILKASIKLCDFKDCDLSCNYKCLFSIFSNLVYKGIFLRNFIVVYCYNTC